MKIIDIECIVIHKNLINPKQLAVLKEKLEKDQELILVKKFDNQLVYQLQQ